MHQNEERLAKITDTTLSATQQAVHVINQLATVVYRWAVDKGFWESEDRELGTKRNDGEMIALMHSELSELLEAIRGANHGAYLADEHCPEFSNVEIECADLIIRMLDFCGGRQLRIGEALMAKINYNYSRMHKHGKAF